jgi:hypothetical protein
MYALTSVRMRQNECGGYNYKIYERDRRGDLQGG